MENTHGYNPLSWQLIRLFQSGEPDFEAAEKLIGQGADINDQGDDKDENVLSEIIQGYWDSGACNLMFDECPNERVDYYNCPRCKHNSNPNVSWAETLEHAEKIGIGTREYELVVMK